MKPFSFQTRAEAIQKFPNQEFDLLIVGGGITGAAVARDAIQRGLSVALIEKSDYASGTSSKSSKLVHGGLRYLEQREFKLVFEALNERTLLLKNSSTTVRPLPFYFPVYQTDRRGMGILSLGLWLYDLFTLFRTPGFHRRLSKKKMLAAMPALKDVGLKGGFRYFDASMWDDLMVIEILRDAVSLGAVSANYCEAQNPIWDGDRVSGFQVRDCLCDRSFEIRAKQVVVCAGPWTDQLGATMSSSFKPWLAPSRGVHLVFDSKRFSVPGAVVMSTEQDGRIAFVIPRPDFGSGVTIVGTTDGPSPKNPDQIEDAKSSIQTDVKYLLGLLSKYFPSLNLCEDDIQSVYLGIRPLVAPGAGAASSAESLQKLSREHHIGWGPGKVVMVAGGKYTTHRTMAEEIVDFAIQNEQLTPSTVSHTHQPFFNAALPTKIQDAKREMKRRGVEVPQLLWDRMGAEAIRVIQIDQESIHYSNADPEGFPMLEAQLRYSIRFEGVVHLEDFVFRRVPLFLSRKDHGEAWWWPMAQVWADEHGLKNEEAFAAARSQFDRLKTEVIRRESWR